jgi:sugar phosphate isomerase/epimerase
MTGPARLSLNKLSLNTATVRHATIPEAIEACTQAGIGGIGLWRDRVAETGAAQAARLVRQAGLTVTSLCRGGFFAAAGAARDNRRAVEEAAAVGTDVLVLVSGGLPVGSKDLPGARARVAAQIAELARYAARRGVKLAIEPLHPVFCADRCVITTLEQALDIAEQFPATQVGVVIDTYQLWWDPALGEQIERAGASGRILSFQVSDWLTSQPDGPLLGRGHLGDGCIDIPAIAAQVAAAGYIGFTEVEIFNHSVWRTPATTTAVTVAERFRACFS